MFNNRETNHSDKVLFMNKLPLSPTGVFSNEGYYGLNINTHYYNLTSNDFTISTRDGVKFNLSPSKERMFGVPIDSYEGGMNEELEKHRNKCHNKIVVRKQFIMLYKDFVKFKAHVETNNTPTSSFLHYVYTAFSKVANEKRPMAGVYNIRDFIDDARLSITVDTVLDPYQDNIGKDDIYFTEEDIVISFKNLDNASSHPALNSQSKILIDEDAYKKSDIFVTHDIVSNNSDMVLYLNSSGHVTKIKSRKDKTLNNGVYKNIYIRDNVSGSHKLFESFRVELNNMNELGVFHTKELAVAGGNMDDARRERIKELEYNLSVHKNESEAQLITMKRELEETKRASAEKELENKAELERVKSVYAEKQNKLDEESMVRKNYYEERSHSRKDTSESLKLAPTIITGAIGVAGAVGTVLALKASAGIAAVGLTAGISTMKFIGIAALITTALMATKKVVEYVDSGDNFLSSLASRAYNGVKSFISNTWEGVKNVGSAICDGVCGFVGRLFSW